MQVFVSSKMRDHLVDCSQDRDILLPDGACSLSGIMLAPLFWRCGWPTDVLGILWGYAPHLHINVANAQESSTLMCQSQNPSYRHGKESPVDR